MTNKTSTNKSLEDLLDKYEVVDTSHIRHHEHDKKELIKVIKDKWIKDEINGVPVTVKICKHKLSYLECEDCLGSESLAKAKIVNMESWWRKLLRRFK